MKLKPISWYYLGVTGELVIGPIGYNDHAKQIYELESANPAADSFMCVHTIGIDVPSRYYLGRHHAEQIVQKYKLPINGQNLEIPAIALIQCGHNPT